MINTTVPGKLNVIICDSMLLEEKQIDGDQLEFV